MPKSGVPQVIGVIILLGFCEPAFTQNATSRKMVLEQLLQQANTGNLSLQASRAGIGYWKQLQSATTELPRTQVGAEYGNINSFQNDSRFYINQSFELPVVYRRQKELYAALESEVTRKVVFK